METTAKGIAGRDHRAPAGPPTSDCQNRSTCRRVCSGEVALSITTSARSRLQVQTFLGVLPGGKFLLRPPTGQRSRPTARRAAHQQTLTYHKTYPNRPPKATAHPKPRPSRPEAVNCSACWAKSRPISGWVNCSKYLRSRGPLGGRQTRSGPAVTGQSAPRHQTPHCPTAALPRHEWRPVARPHGRRDRRRGDRRPRRSSSLATRLLPPATPPRMPITSILSRRAVPQGNRVNSGRVLTHRVPPLCIGPIGACLYVHFEGDV